MYYQDLLVQSYLKLTTKEHRKTYAQFFTPPAIAELMAAYILDNPSCRQILDPAAGLSIFASALDENLRYLNESETLQGLIAYNRLYIPPALEQGIRHDYQSLLNRSLEVLPRFATDGDAPFGSRVHQCNYFGLLAFNSNEVGSYFSRTFGDEEKWQKSSGLLHLTPRYQNLQLAAKAPKSHTSATTLSFECSPYNYNYESQPYPLGTSAAAAAAESSLSASTANTSNHAAATAPTASAHTKGAEPGGESSSLLTSCKSQHTLNMGSKKQQLREIELVGYEVDPIILEFNRFLMAQNPFAHVHYNLRHKDYLKSNFKERYDGIICNPPYLTFKEFSPQPKTIGMLEERLECKLPKRLNLYALFLLKSLVQLKPNGRCAYLIPYEFLNSSFGVKLKEQFLKQRNLSYVITFNLKGPIFDNATTTCGLFLFDNTKEQESVEFITVHSLDELTLLTLRLCPNLFKLTQQQPIQTPLGVLLTHSPSGYGFTSSSDAAKANHPEEAKAEPKTAEAEPAPDAAAPEVATASAATASQNVAAATAAASVEESKATSPESERSTDAAFAAMGTALPRHEYVQLLKNAPALISCLSAIHVNMPEHTLSAEDERTAAATMAYLEKQGRFIPSFTLNTSLQDLVMRICGHAPQAHEGPQGYQAGAAPLKATESTAPQSAAPTKMPAADTAGEGEAESSHSLILSYASICHDLLQGNPTAAVGEDSIMIRGHKVPYTKLNAKKKWHIYYQERLHLPHLVVGPKLSMDKLSTFDKFIKVKRGLATGANDYFLFNRSKKEELKLKSKFFVPVIPRANFVELPIFTEKDFEKLVEDDAPVFLLNAPDVIHDVQLQKYIALGEEQNIHKRYLTRHRSPWYALERREVAPILMSVFNRGSINVVRNEAQIYNLTTFHSIFVLDESQTDLIFAYLLTPLAKDIILQNRREYGGGLEKLEPLDINHAACVNFNALTQETTSEILGLYQKYRAIILGLDGDKKTKESQANELIHEISASFTSLLSH